MNRVAPIAVVLILLLALVTAFVISETPKPPDLVRDREAILTAAVQEIVRTNEDNTKGYRLSTYYIAIDDGDPEPVLLRKWSAFVRSSLRPISQYHGQHGLVIGLHPRRAEVIGDTVKLGYGFQFGPLHGRCGTFALTRKFGVWNVEYSGAIYQL